MTVAHNLVVKMTEIVKPILSLAAVILTFIAFGPYIYSIYTGKTRPHVFSWVIWGVTTVIVFFAQIEADGGVGAWPIGISGMITLGIAFLAFMKRADITITKLDWLFFITAIASVPFWFFTANPLWAVVVLTAVDLLGFGPTLRKAYDQPYEENTVFFGLFLIRNLLVVFALESYSVTTILFPLAVSIASAFVITVIIYRRKIVVE